MAADSVKTDLNWSLTREAYIITREIGLLGCSIYFRIICSLPKTRLGTYYMHGQFSS